MTKDELIASLNFLFDPEESIGLIMYMIVDSPDGPVEKMANIEDDVKDQLLEQFLGYIQSKFINNQELYFANISEGQNRKNAVYYYDLEETIEGLAPLGSVLGNDERDYFDFSENNFDSIKGYVFLIGNETKKIAVYKKQYSVSLIKRDSILSIIRSDERLVKITQDIIKLNETFEFLQLGEHLIVVSLKVLERFFGFSEVIKRLARENLAIIGNCNILESTDPLHELADETRFARKLMRVKTTSQVLTLPFDTIKKFINKHPKLKKSVKFNALGNRIALETRTSKELFLKLLDDDFLKSDLTKSLYDAENKDKLDEIEEA